MSLKSDGVIKFINVDGVSWDEVPGKMSSRKKFFCDVISGADFAAGDFEHSWILTRSIPPVTLSS